VNQRGDVPYKGDSYLHYHDLVVNLDPQDEPILPGFMAALIGAEVDEEREFELDIPDDKDEYKETAGRKVRFRVLVKKVEVVTLPELSEDFAARVTKDEDEPLTLLQLRMRIRENLQKEAEREAKSAYGNAVLDDIVAQAEVRFPEALVLDQLKDMLDDLDRRLRQQGIRLEDYKRITGKTDDDLYDEYRETAVKIIKRSLVLQELVKVEKIRVSDFQLESHIDEMVEQFGEQGPAFRDLLDTPRMRDNLLNDLTQEAVFERIRQIAQGMEPQIDVAEVEAEAQTVEAIEESSLEVVEPVEESDLTREE
jgi:trigger factor